MPGTNPSWEKRLYELGLLYQIPQIVWDQLIEQLGPYVDLHTQERLFHLSKLCQTQDKLIVLFHHWWEQQQPIHWGCYLNILTDLGFKLDEPTVTEWRNYIGDDSEALKTLSFSKEARKIIPELSSTLETWRKQQEQGLHDRLGNTIQQLEVLLSQGLWDQAEEVLQQLKKLAPKDNRWQDWELKIKKEKAHMILEKPIRAKPRYHQYLKSDPATIRAQEDSVLSLDDWKTVLEQNQLDHYDQALFFLFADQVEMAENILKENISQAEEKALWLLLDCFIIQEKFIEAYDLLENMIKPRLLQTEIPEAWLRYYYEMARIHWGLGDKTKALQLIDRVIDIDADWRDALLLRSLWLSQEGAGRE